MKKVALTLTVMIVLGLGGWLYWWWHGPAYGTVARADKNSDASVLGSQEELIAWHNPFFTTRYTSSLRILTSNEVAHGSIDAQYLLSSISHDQEDQLAVTVGNLGTAQLSEMSSVKFRATRVDIYRQIDRAYAPRNSYVYGKIAGYETGIFWSEGNRYAEVVVSGSSACQAELENALEAIIVNWQWQ